MSRNVFLQLKKKLIGLTREHEALFSFVEKNKQICTEKEKQKVFVMVHWLGKAINTVLFVTLDKITAVYLHLDVEQID